MIAHIGFVRSGWPVVLPFHFGLADLHDGLGEQMIIHGSTGGHAFQEAAARPEGVPVSVCVSLNDGLVLGRSLYDIGAHYRSVVAYGHAHAVPEDLRGVALDALVDHVIPGRRKEVRPPSRKEIASTAVIAIPLTHASAKIADESTGDTPGDGQSRELWAGVIPLRLRARTPVASPESMDPEDLPRSVWHFVDALNDH